MGALRAQVRRGRLEMAEPTEGSVIERGAVDAGDDLDDDERAELHAAIDEGLAADDDELVDAWDLIAELRSRG